MTKQLVKGDIANELMAEGVSDYDLCHMTEIIKQGEGSWYHAHLLRALYILLKAGDSSHVQRLKIAYPGASLAVQLWYDGCLPVREVEDVDARV